MTCRDFDRIWNDRLDARAGPPDVVRTLEDHAASCPSCQALGLRYQTLHQAIRAWGPPPSPPPDFAERLLAGRDVLTIVGGPRSSWVVPIVRYAAAAALLVAGTLGVRSLISRTPAPVIATVAPAPPRLLTASLADATSATWDLARATSAPAARIGRDAIGSTTLPESPIPLPVAEVPTARVLRTVGDRVNAGIRPLSGSARHAFGFLLGPARVAEGPTSRPREGA